MDIEEVTQLVCSMANDFHKKGNMSMIDLLKETGYLSIKNKPNERHFEQYLNKNTEIVQSWLNNSMDTRSSPAWYISEKGTGSEWVVGFYPSTKERVFKDKNKACALYINNYIKQLYDLT